MTFRDVKKEKKKKEIIQSAVSIVSEKGYHATTMEEIAANLLMTKGSVYYYFQNKQDLVYQSQQLLLTSSIHHIQSIIREKMPIKKRLKRAIAVHVEYLIEEKAGFELGARPEQLFSGEQLKQVLKLRNEYSSYFDQLIQEGVEEKVFASRDVKRTRNLLLGAMNGVISWYSETGKLTKVALAEEIAEDLIGFVEGVER